MVENFLPRFRFSLAYRDLGDEILLLFVGEADDAQLCNKI